MLQFIHSPTGGHLGCLQVLAIMNKTAINMCAGFYVDITLQLSWVKRALPLDHMVRLCLTCKKPPNCLPKWLYHFAFPPTINECSCCSTSCQHLVV